MNDLRQAASSEQAAAGGRLDAAILRLLQALDPSYALPAGERAAGATARLEALELLTATLQVGWREPSRHRQAGTQAGMAWQIA